MHGAYGRHAIGVCTEHGASLHSGTDLASLSNVHAMLRLGTDLAVSEGGSLPRPRMTGNRDALKFAYHTPTIS